jgi:hypothetical protein
VVGSLFTEGSGGILKPSGALRALGLSLAGLLLLVPLTLGYAGGRLSIQPQLTGIVFVLICFTGTIVGMYPKVVSLTGRGLMRAGGGDKKPSACI